MTTADSAPPETSREPTVWRAKLFSERDDLCDDELRDRARAYCRSAGVVGVGWGRWTLKAPDGAPLEEVLAEIRSIEGWKAGGDTVRRLAQDAHEGDLVWTRDSRGAYWLGRITGPWRFDGSDEASRWDLNNVRDCEWLERSFRDWEVPGAVVRSFTGRSSSFSRVAPNDRGGWRVTGLIWRQTRDPSLKPPRLSPEEVLTDLLDPIDAEDVALLYLQSRGWLLLPSSRMNDTPLYEAALKHVDDGRLAVLAVKSGGQNPVPVSAVVAEVADRAAEVFVFSTHERFDGDPQELDATVISRAEVSEFMSARFDLLPPRIARWIELA
jgi:hypothetical protein